MYNYSANKVVFMLIIIMLSIITSGCLIVEKASQPNIGGDSPKLEKLIEDFFKLNANEKNYPVTDIENLFTYQTKSNEVVRINYISGAPDYKTYNQLARELQKQKNIFNNQTNYDLNLEYKFQKLNTDNISYIVNFRVWESIKGMGTNFSEPIRYEQKHGYLTDNGIIIFQFQESASSWKIEHLTINYEDVILDTKKNSKGKVVLNHGEDQNGKQWRWAETK